MPDGAAHVEDGPLRRLLDDQRLVVRESFEHGEEHGLTAAERVLVSRAVPTRRREFAAGRRAARAALLELGAPATSILSGPRGEPAWPASVVGSITHCVGVTVARRGDVRAVGIDAEPDLRLPDGVLETIASPAERSMVVALSADGRAVAWDRLVFCVKEVVFKIWYPLALSWLDFGDAEVVVDPDRGTFRASLLRPSHELAALCLPAVLRGRWSRERGVLVAAAWIEARARSGEAA